MVDMAEIAKGINKSKMTLNVTKTKCMLSTSSQWRRFVDRGGDFHNEVINLKMCQIL